MKVNIKTDEKGYAIGYDLIPESKEEQLTLGTVRNMIFFGIDDTHLEYDGRTSETIEGVDYITSLKWIQKKHQDN